MDNCDGVLVYIDNSNIFINTQQYAAKQLQFKYGVTQDIRSRVDIGKLVNLAIKGRKLIRGKLYGSEPPALDTVWKSIRRKDIEVSHSKRSSWNSREKNLDTELVSDAVADIIKKRDEATENSAVIIFTGDKDMKPVVERALEEGWKMEIWSYKNALSNELIKLKEKSEKIQIHLMDDAFNKVAFWAYNWLKRLPKDRTIICCFSTSSNVTEGKRLVEFAMKESSKLFQLPTVGRFVDESNKVLAILPTMPPNYNFRGRTIKYDFNKDIFVKLPKLKSIINCLEITPLIKSIQDYQDLYELSEDEEQIDDKESEQDHDEDEIGMSEFITVIRKELKKMQLYSDPCINRYRCNKGKNCKYSHSVLEKEYFKEQPKAGARFKYRLFSAYIQIANTRKSHICVRMHTVFLKRVA